jgi:hypothetical protein
VAAAVYMQFGQTVARREVAAAEIMQFGQTESRREGGGGLHAIWADGVET